MIAEYRNCQGFDRSRLERIAGWMQGYVDTGRYPGAAILLHRGGQEVMFAACGRRNREAGLDFTRDTVVRLYSMTKPVTTVAMMILVERGMCHLDAPVSAFVPAFADMQALIDGATRIDQTAACAPPTLHQLLTHTSGLSYAFNPGLLPEAMAAADIQFTPDQASLAVMVDDLSSLPLAFAPGQRWEYSVGLDVIGRVIEVISGRTLGAFLSEEILEPLGMTETGFTVADGVGDRFASLYSSLPGDGFVFGQTRTAGGTLRLIDRAGHSPFEGTTLQSGGGGLVGTIDDYMRFALMLKNGGTLGASRILGPRTLAFMMRNHLRGDIAAMGPKSFAEQPMDGVGFGLGGAVVLDPALARIPGNVGDFSWGGLASTFFWVDPVLDLAVVFLTQVTPSSSYPSRAEMKALVHGAVTGNRQEP